MTPPAENDPSFVITPISYRRPDILDKRVSKRKIQFCRDRFATVRARPFLAVRPGATDTSDCEPTA